MKIVIATDHNGVSEKEIIIKNLEETYEIIDKNINKSKVFVTGIPISNRFLQKYSKQEIMAQYQLDENKKTILFFGGGEFGLGKTRTFQIFESFLKCTLPIQIIAIAGKNKKMKITFEEIVKKYNKQNTVKILGFTNQVPELMAISDLVVTKPGGLTTSESLASNLPMVVINPIPGQEKENAEFLEENEIAVWIKKSDDNDKIINDLLSNESKLNQMKKNTNILAKPNSTAEICNILLK